jgi:hypothetical protein
MSFENKNITVPFESEREARKSVTFAEDELQSDSSVDEQSERVSLLSSMRKSIRNRNLNNVIILIPF